MQFKPAAAKFLLTFSCFGVLYRKNA